ncbi:MAG: flippase-like domain-containing protein [Pseudodesulfovibrio sp.]|nr:flippase-like domain-containing protein [Pseudodesulfovibrio sp.]
MTKRVLISSGLFLVGITLFGFIFYETGITVDVVLSILKKMDLFYVALCPVLVVVFFIFSSMKWRLVTQAQTEERLGLFFYFRYISLSATVGQVLPLTLTNAAIRAFAMKRKDVMPPMKTAGLFLWDQGFDFLALSMLMVAGISYVFFGLNMIFVVMLLGSLIAVVYLAMPFFIRFIAWFAGRLGRISFFPDGLCQKFLALQNASILDSLLARKLFVLAICKFMTGSLLYTVIVMASGFVSIVDIVFWGSPSAEMAGVLSQMPGGLGAFDWTWIGVFTKSGLGAQTAASLAVGLRCLLVLTNVFVTLCTLSVYFLFVRQKGKRQVGA